MKPFFLLWSLLASYLLFSQVTPQIYFASPNMIQGAGEIGTTIEMSTDTDFVAEHTVPVDTKGNFTFTFPTTLTVGDNIIVWTLNSKQETSQKIIVKIEKPDSILAAFSSGNLTTTNDLTYVVSGKTVKYKATIWNTNFSIPLARFNFTKNDNQKVGDLLLFNSIGAGFGISGGELSETRNEQGTIINQEFVNRLGIHFGFLFSAGTGEDTKNVFAPTLNLSILDFQVGLGYELGTLSENQRPIFLTLSYAIPLYKLKKNGFWIWKNSTPIINPQQARLGE